MKRPGRALPPVHQDSTNCRTPCALRVRLTLISMSKPSRVNASISLRSDNWEKSPRSASDSLGRAMPLISTITCSVKLHTSIIGTLPATASGSSDAQTHAEELPGRTATPPSPANLRGTPAQSACGGHRCHYQNDILQSMKINGSSLNYPKLLCVGRRGGAMGQSRP